MRNDGIHMPELPEPTLDELERLAEAIGERADGFELDMPDGSVARGYRAPGIHGTLPEGWRVYDIMECDSERWTPYPGYEDVAEADREDGENGRYETSLVIDDNPGPTSSTRATRSSPDTTCPAWTGSSTRDTAAMTASSCPTTSHVSPRPPCPSWSPPGRSRRSDDKDKRISIYVCAYPLIGFRSRSWSSCG